MPHSNFKALAPQRRDATQERGSSTVRLINPLQTVHTHTPAQSAGQRARLTEPINSYKCEADSQSSSEDDFIVLAPIFASI